MEMPAISKLREQFQNPPCGYGPAPRWEWNGDMDCTEMKWQIEEMHRKGIEEFFVAARKGMPFAYLSEEWFSRVDFTLKKAKMTVN